MRIYIQTKRYSLEGVKNAWIYLYFRRKTVLCAYQRYFREVNMKRARKEYIKIHICRRQYRTMQQYIVNNDAIIKLMCKLNMKKVRKVDEALKNFIKLKNL